MAVFSEIYSKLNAEKQQAIKEEDFQRASNIKTVVSNFKQLEAELVELYTEKQEALQREDYDRCHRIKQLIHNKREVVEYQRLELFQNEKEFYSHNIYSHPNDKIGAGHELKRTEEAGRRY